MWHKGFSSKRCNSGGIFMDHFSTENWNSSAPSTKRSLLAS